MHDGVVLELGVLVLDTPTLVVQKNVGERRRASRGVHGGWSWMWACVARLFWRENYGGEQRCTNRGVH